jgi:hypothetical protein
MKGYHFTGDTLRNGEPIPKIGEWLVYEGKIEPCVSGLHASKHPSDALKYAPGNLLHLVELEGEIVSHGNPIDKYVGRKRKIIKSIDATTPLREFSRWCALEIVHLWNVPDIVISYLKTGDESFRAAARAAVTDAVWAESTDAVWAASADAVWATAAATAAASDAASAAASAAVWAAEIKKQRNKFKEMILKCLK